MRRTAQIDQVSPDRPHLHMSFQCHTGFMRLGTAHTYTAWRRRQKKKKKKAALETRMCTYQSKQHENPKIQRHFRQNKRQERDSLDDDPPSPPTRSSSIAKLTRQSACSRVARSRDTLRRHQQQPKTTQKSPPRLRPGRGTKRENTPPSENRTPHGAIECLLQTSLRQHGYPVLSLFSQQRHQGAAWQAKHLSRPLGRRHPRPVRLGPPLVAAPSQRQRTVQNLDENRFPELTCIGVIHAPRASGSRIARVGEDRGWRGQTL